MTRAMGTTGDLSKNQKVTRARGARGATGYQSKEATGVSSLWVQVFKLKS